MSILLSFFAELFLRSLEKSQAKFLRLQSFKKATIAMATPFSFLLINMSIIFSMLSTLTAASYLPLKSTSSASLPPSSGSDSLPHYLRADQTSFLLQRLLRGRIAEAQCGLKCKEKNKQDTCVKTCQEILRSEKSALSVHQKTSQRPSCSTGCWRNMETGGFIKIDLRKTLCFLTWNQRKENGQLSYLVVAKDLGGKWHLVANPLDSTSISRVLVEHYIEVRLLVISEEGLQDEASLLLDDDISLKPSFVRQCQQDERQERNTPDQNISEKKKEEKKEGGKAWQHIEIVILLLPSFFIILSFLAVFLMVRQKKADTKTNVEIETDIEDNYVREGSIMPPLYEAIDNYCVL